MVIVNGHPGVIERAINNVDDMDEVENKAVDANGRIIAISFCSMTLSDCARTIWERLCKTSGRHSGRQKRQYSLE